MNLRSHSLDKLRQIVTTGAESSFSLNRRHKLNHYDRRMIAVAVQ
eukprot:SAG25_NODE_731_length_5686_cov_14.271523_8_plen_45_part_00